MKGIIIKVCFHPDMDRENENSEDFDASIQSSIEDNDSEVEEDITSKPQTKEGRYTCYVVQSFRFV